MSAALQSPLGRVALESPSITLGRAADNLLVVSDIKASGHHAVIQLHGESHSITDLGSTNGTFVNERRLERNIPQFLKAGDKIRIGDTVFIYEYQQPAPSLDDTAIDAKLPTGYDATVKAPPSYQPGVPQSNAPVQTYNPGYTPAPPATPSSPAYPAYGILDPNLAFQATQLSSQSYNQPTPPRPVDPVPYNQPTPSQPADPLSYNVAANPSYAPVPPTAYSSTPSAPSAPYGGAQEQFGGPQNQPWSVDPYNIAATSPQAPQAYPPQAYTPPAAPKKSGKGVMIAVIVILVILVLGGGGGGTAYYFATRPKPVITITSDFHKTGVVAGATGTTFKVSGTDFSYNSAVTFLLDDKAIPGVQPAQSDNQGNVTTTLKVTDDWSVGDHTLTARDASDYLTKAGLSLKVVAQGDAHTPGPNGAPPDDAKGTVVAAITTSGGNFTDTLSVNTSSSGAVCIDKDDGQPHSTNGSANNGVTYTLTVTATCSGSYKAGKIVYIENVSAANIVYSNGLNCTIRVPFENQHLEGTFTDKVTVSGAYTTSALTLDCDHNVGTQSLTAQTGTWTGVGRLT